MKLTRLLLATLAVAALATAAVLVNLALLGGASAQNEPVGTLSPAAKLPAPPSWTIRPAHGRSEQRDSADD